MEGDSELLTDPVPKSRSVVKMLKKQISMEAKRGSSSGPGPNYTAYSRDTRYQSRYGDSDEGEKGAGAYGQNHYRQPPPQRKTKHDPFPDIVAPTPSETTSYDSYSVDSNFTMPQTSSWAQPVHLGQQQNQPYRKSIKSSADNIELPEMRIRDRRNPQVDYRGDDLFPPGGARGQDGGASHGRGRGADDTTARKTHQQHHSRRQDNYSAHPTGRKAYYDSVTDYREDHTTETGPSSSRDVRTTSPGIPPKPGTEKAAAVVAVPSTSAYAIRDSTTPTAATVEPKLKPTLLKRPQQQDKSQEIDQEPRGERHVRIQGPNDTWTVNPGSYFVYGPTFSASDPSESKSRNCCEWWDDMWSPYGGFRRLTSPWIYASLSLLFVANCMFMVAFLTNNWGVLHMPPEAPTPNPNITVAIAFPVDTAPQSTSGHAQTDDMTSSAISWARDAWRSFTQTIEEDFGYKSGTSERHKRSLTQQQTSKSNYTEVNGNKKVEVLKTNHDEPPVYWRFGLWRCCRNTDGLCLGPRFESFYGATRTFAVLGLFSMILSFSWMLGHTLEKLLDYDVCTMSCLISLSYASSIFVLIAVMTFGIRWPVDFANEFHGSDPHFSYSFILAALSFLVTLAAAICATVDLKTGLDNSRKEAVYYTEEEAAGIEAASDMPTDNIARPRGYKKKRTAPVANVRYFPTNSESNV